MDGIWLGAAGIRSTEYGYTKICTNEKQGAKIPLVKVLEILKNFFQEVFKQGSGQSPEVLKHETIQKQIFHSLPVGRGGDCGFDVGFFAYGIPRIGAERRGNGCNTVPVGRKPLLRSG